MDTLLWLAGKNQLQDTTKTRTTTKSALSHAQGVQYVRMLEIENGSTREGRRV